MKLSVYNLSFVLIVMAAFTADLKKQRPDNDRLEALSFNPAEPHPAGEKSFAVIELFTSEGCSSCPSADALVERISKEDHDMPVYILGYHVDYWNRLGWKDIYSSPEYSNRQRRYAQWFRLKSIYTPQIVVNGKQQFTGSNEGKLRSAISDVNNPAENYSLKLSGIRVQKNYIAFNYEYAAKDLNNDLQIAVVQKSALSEVSQGENSGRKLSHINIVRKQKTIAIKNTTGGEMQIDLPEDLKKKSWELIAFVQNRTTGEIIAADKHNSTSPSLSSK